jgi:F5/8 type C domain
MHEKSTDSFNPAEWQPVVSGNAELRLSTATAAGISSLKMDFDFKGGAGFVVARQAHRRRMPEEFAMTFRLRGTGAVNHLELKLVDATGQNVWRHVQKDLRPPPRWKRMNVDSQDIEFAWGPSSGGRVQELGSVEIAIVAGEGGRGTWWIADLTIEDRTPTRAPTIKASTAQPDFAAAAALLGSGWKPQPDDLRPWIAIDFTAPRPIGGLVIDWLEHAPLRGFRVRGSNNGVRWKALHTASAAGGPRSYVYLPGLKTRFLRLDLDEPSAGAALRVQSFEFSRSIHAFWNHVAQGEARGWHPRWLHNEQTLWTPFGRSNGIHCALMDADGMVEVDQGSFSIEPMLWVQGRLFTWADVVPRQELQDGWMPAPSVIWETRDWRLRIHAQATTSGASRLRHRFENLTDRQVSARLFLLIRPFQVTPPWQSFRNVGGVSPIRDLAWRDGAVHVNDVALIVPESGEGSIAMAGFGALRFDDGFMAAHLTAGVLPPATQVHDPFEFATGALGFELSAGPHQSAETLVNCMPAAAPRAADEPAFEWHGEVPVTQWSGNGWMTEVVQAAFTATAHILVTRSGPALQPGPRRYTRSWIRDGAMMSAALLRMGHVREVAEYIRWYAPHQRADGFVPCCVDVEGTDWLVEHDSHGELLALIGDYHRFTSDHALLADSWTYIDRAAGCIEKLLGPDGLMPVSVSHEGYLAQPVHSYWDDFWTLRGLKDAVDLANAAGRADRARDWLALCARFADSLYASIETTRSQRKLDFVPGSIEWADFDPTATANAIYLLDVPVQLDRNAVERTFDKYFADWRSKRSGAVASANYTPYEIRIIGAFVRLGRRDAALELLRFFLSDRRPAPWNQWPEIAWRDSRAPAHLGDLPHTWIAAEYVLAVRSLIAYEREADRSLVLAAGVAPEWIEGAGLHVTQMPTPYGALSYSLQRMDSATLRFEMKSAVSARLVLRPPLAGALETVLIDGRACTSFDGNSVTLSGAPAVVICTTS